MTMREITASRIIQMNGVSTSYDSENPVLKDVTLSVKRGANYAIVGPSGSGKSTLLKLINGMMRPRAGTVRIDYDAPTDRSFARLRSKIGYIPQNLGLVKNLTVLDNVLIGALARTGRLKSLFGSFPKEEIGRAHDILDSVGLDDKSARKAYMLSGGEKRRVAIARALMQKPDILLADEIVSELDHKTAVDILDLIEDAQKKLGLTAIMVHHDMQLALQYANRVAVVKDGQKILEIGVEGDKIVDFESGNHTPHEIWEMYDESKK